MVASKWKVNTSRASTWNNWWKYPSQTVLWLQLPSTNRAYRLYFMFKLWLSSAHPRVSERRNSGVKRTKLTSNLQILRQSWKVISFVAWQDFHFHRMPALSGRTGRKQQQQRKERVPRHPVEKYILDICHTASTCIVLLRLFFNFSCVCVWICYGCCMFGLCCWLGRKSKLLSLNPGQIVAKDKLEFFGRTHVTTAVV